MNLLYEQGATSVNQCMQGNLDSEIAHLSSICAQPCRFEGVDAEAGALTYTGVRVLLLRTIEQQENIHRLFEAYKTLSHETQTSIAACSIELTSLRNHVNTLQQNTQDVHGTLQGQQQRIEQLENITHGLGNMDGILSSFEQRIHTNAASIGQLDGKQHELAERMAQLCSAGAVDQRIRELNELFAHRVSHLEQAIQDVQTQKVNLTQLPSIVSCQLQTALTPLETDVDAMYRLWDLNKSDVHGVAYSSTRDSVARHVQLVHSTPPILALLDMLRAPAHQSVTVGPASMVMTANISSSHISGSGPPPLSPRTAASAKSQAAYLGIEVGPSGESTVGVVVTRVLPGTPAAASGLRVGDVLVAMNNQSFSDVAGLVNVARQCLAARPVSGGAVTMTRVKGNDHEKVELWLP